MSTPLYVDIHALQTVPYANLNRDDLGSPKTVIYGGAERTRVSSQSWKRVVRHEIERRLGDPAIRTRRSLPCVIEQAASLPPRPCWRCCISGAMCWCRSRLPSFSVC